MLLWHAHHEVMHGVMQLLRNRLLLLRCPSQGITPKLRVDEREILRVYEEDGLSCSDKGIEIDSNVCCCEWSLAC